MKAWKVSLKNLFHFSNGAPPSKTRATLPFLCSNISKILPKASIDRIAAEDSTRRDDEVTRFLGVDGLSKIEKALGFAPFYKLQTEKELLRIFESVSFDPAVFEPINQVLNKLSGNRRWALYLMTGFHAVATHSDGHREMIEGSAEMFPKAALLGGNSPKLLDIGIGNGNLLAASMASNPKAILYGVDVAGGSLSRCMAVINSIADEVQDTQPPAKRFDYGRFGLIRGSASDPHLLDGKRIDGASIVLTLFTLPAAERKQVLRLMAERINPGGTLVLVDPVPNAGTAQNAIAIMQTVMKSAFRNNEELTALDVAIVTAMNMHSLLKTDFLSAEQQTKLGEEVGLIPVGSPKNVYYGIANRQVFEKPWKAKGKRRGKAALMTSELAELCQSMEDQLRRRVSKKISVYLAGNSDRRRIEKFVREQRAAQGVKVSKHLEQDLRNIEKEYQAKGGFFFVIQDEAETILGTAAYAPMGSKEAEIRKMYFVEDCQKIGLGENMLDIIIRFAAARGISRVYGETNQKLKSVQMLKSAGFVPTRNPPKKMPVLLPEEGQWFVKHFPQ